jgi:hypothetical protein
MLEKVAVLSQMIIAHSPMFLEFRPYKKAWK